MEPIDIPSTSPPEEQDRDYTFSLKRCSDKVRERGLDVEISFAPNKNKYYSMNEAQGIQKWAL